jgi:hypothetical protein
MRVRAQYAEYLAEVREQVCGHCPERPADRAVFVPACRHCGVELQLPRIVESIHDAGDTLAEFDPSPDRHLVCARCHCLDGGLCPCPAGGLATAVVRAVKSVDERREQWAWVRRRIPRPARVDHAPAAALIEAYEAATGTLVGCD